MDRLRVTQRSVVGALTLGAATLALVATSFAGGIGVKVVSRNSHGALANGDSSTQSPQLISADGHLTTFESYATNLGANGSFEEIFSRNLRSGKTRLLSRQANGDPATSELFSPVISEDGRFVAYWGLGGGLPGSAPTHYEAWITNVRTGKTRLISKAHDGTPADGSTLSPALSADGRYVAFRTTSTNLPGGDGTNEYVYVRDTEKNRTILASVTSDGTPAPASEYGQTISANGRLVVFLSNDAALPGGDGTTYHVYLRNLKRRTTTLMDALPNGTPGDASADDPSISPNGRYVAFPSAAANLPGSDGGGSYLYERNLQTKKLKLVSRTSSGQLATAGDVRLSGDGKVVAFDSTDARLPGGDGSKYEVYARDPASDKTFLMSRTSSGTPADSDSYYPSISQDGRFVTFDSVAGNLVGASGPLTTRVYRVGPLP